MSTKISKRRAHHQAEISTIVQLMPGICVEAGDDIDETVLHGAVGIACYLYPRAYLSTVSAVLLFPTHDGHLFISRPRSQHTRVRPAAASIETQPTAND